MTTRSTPLTRHPLAVVGTTVDGEAHHAARRHGPAGVLHRAAVDATPARDVPPIADEALRSTGQPLDEVTRAFIEHRLGHDFGHVRVHTDARAAEAARAVNALAYTAGADVVFGAGQYAPARDTGRRLLAHELAHVVQQRHHAAGARGGALAVGSAASEAEREADHVANALAGGHGAAPAVSHVAPPHSLQRAPGQTTTVRVNATGYTTIKNLQQGKGTSGAVVYDYPAIGQHMPPDRDVDKPGKPFEIKLPLLVYPPAVIDPPTVDVFVFFHGMRADYEEGKPAQGTEPIALWTHLQEAVAGTDRVGIAPQAPATARKRTTKKADPADKTKMIEETKWEDTTAQWHEALGKVRFDGLIKIALDRLSADLGITPPLEARHIHVAGHSAGGQGIIESTRIDAGAKALGDKVQDVTLQDAGYGWRWDHVLNWFLEGSPGKTVRVLVSQAVGGPLEKPHDTRAVQSTFNAAKIRAAIVAKKKTAALEVEEKTVPAPKDQKPRPGGFHLETHVVVKDKTSGAVHGTLVVFFAPGGGHYETATASMRAGAAAGPTTTDDFLGEAKPGKFRVVSRPGPLFADKALGSKLKDLALDTVVDVKAFELLAPTPTAASKITVGTITTSRYVAQVTSAAGNGWMPLSSLAPAP